VERGPYSRLSAISLALAVGAEIPVDPTIVIAELAERSC
jgi:hypothetical protein